MCVYIVSLWSNSVKNELQRLSTTHSRFATAVTHLGCDLSPSRTGAGAGADVAVQVKKIIIIMVVVVVFRFNRRRVVVHAAGLGTMRMEPCCYSHSCIQYLYELSHVVSLLGPWRRKKTARKGKKVKENWKRRKVKDLENVPNVAAAHKTLGEILGVVPTRSQRPKIYSCVSNSACFVGLSSCICILVY